MSAVLYQIYYKEEQKSSIFPFAVPYFNDSLTIFFENTVIADLVMQNEADKVAVCSYKLEYKMRFRVGSKEPLTPEALNRDYSVLSFSKQSSKHKMMARAHEWHPEFTKAIKLLWEKLGYRMPGEVKHPIYQNHYAATKEIYRSYVLEFLIPAMTLIKEHEELNKLMLSDSQYNRRNKKVDMKSVMEKLGMTYFPLCPFVLERCPSLWFQMKNISVTYL